MKKTLIALLLLGSAKIWCEISLDGIRKAFSGYGEYSTGNDSIGDAIILNPLYGWLMDKSGALRNKRMFCSTLIKPKNLLGAALIALFPSSAGELSHLTNHSSNLTKSLESVCHNYENNQKDLIIERRKKNKNESIAEFDPNVQGLKLKLLAVLFVKSYIDEYKIRNRLSIRSLNQNQIKQDIKTYELFINQNKRKLYTTGKIKLDGENTLNDTTDVLIVCEAGGKEMHDFTLYLSKLPRKKDENNKFTKGNLENIIEFYLNHQNGDCDPSSIAFPINSKAWLMQSYASRALEDNELPVYLKHVRHLLDWADCELHPLNSLASLELVENVCKLLQKFPYTEVTPPSSNAWVHIHDDHKNSLLHDVYADCVEISILHLFNCLLFEFEKKDYSLEHLNAGGLATQKMRDFFQKRTFVSSIDSNAHQEWSEIISNIRDASYPIIYNHEILSADGTYSLHYEALTGFINAFNMLSYISGYSQLVHTDLLFQCSNDIEYFKTQIKSQFESLLNYIRADKTITIGFCWNDAYFGESKPTVRDIFGSVNIKLTLPDGASSVDITFLSNKKHSQVVVDSRNLFIHSEKFGQNFKTDFIKDPAARNVCSMFINVARGDDRLSLSQSKTKYLSLVNGNMNTDNYLLDHLFFLTYPLNNSYRKVLLLDCLLQLCKAAAPHKASSIFRFYQILTASLKVFTHEITPKTQTGIVALDKIFNYFFKKQSIDSIHWKEHADLLEFSITNHLNGALEFYVNAAIQKAKSDKTGLARSEVCSFFVEKIPLLVQLIFDRQSCTEFSMKRLLSAFHWLGVDLGRQNRLVLKKMVSCLIKYSINCKDDDEIFKQFVSFADSVVEENLLAIFASTEAKTSSIYFEMFRFEKKNLHSLPSKHQYLKDLILMRSFNFIFSTSSPNYNFQEVLHFFEFLHDAGARFPVDEVISNVFSFERSPKIDLLVEFAQYFCAKSNINFCRYISAGLIHFPSDLYKCDNSGKNFNLFNDEQIKKIIVNSGNTLCSDLCILLKWRLENSVNLTLAKALESLEYFSKIHDTHGIESIFANIADDTKRGFLLSLFLQSPSYVLKDEAIRVFVNCGLGSFQLVPDNNVYEVYFSEIVAFRMPFNILELEYALSKNYCPTWDDAVFKRLREKKLLIKVLSLVIRHKALSLTTAIEFIKFSLEDLKGTSQRIQFFDKNLPSLLNSIRYQPPALLMKEFVKHISKYFIFFQDCISDFINFFVFNDEAFDNEVIANFFAANKCHLVLFLNFISNFEACLLVQYKLDLSSLFYEEMFSQIFDHQQEFEYRTESVVFFVEFLLRFDSKFTSKFNFLNFKASKFEENSFLNETVKVLFEKFESYPDFLNWLSGSNQ